MLGREGLVLLRATNAGARRPGTTASDKCWGEKAWVQGSGELSIAAENSVFSFVSPVSVSYV